MYFLNTDIFKYVIHKNEHTEEIDKNQYDANTVRT